MHLFFECLGNNGVHTQLRPHVAFVERNFMRGRGVNMRRSWLVRGRKIEIEIQSLFRNSRRRLHGV